MNEIYLPPLHLSYLINKISNMPKTEHLHNLNHIELSVTPVELVQID